MERQRDEGVRCFFPVITAGLLMAVLQAVACPYGILNGYIMNGSTLILLSVAYYIMSSFCHMGQTFVNQVGTSGEWPTLL